MIPHISEKAPEGPMTRKKARRRRMKAVYALFKTYDQAEAAVQELLNQGFDQEDMNVIVQDSVARARMGGKPAGIEGRRAPSGLGEMLSGEQGVNASDTGSIYASGERARMLAHAAASPDGPGILRQLTGFGIDEGTAKAYLDGIKGGGLLFWIITDDDHAHDAGEIVEEHKGGHVVMNPTPRRRR
jgi:hypothetical protein